MLNEKLMYEIHGEDMQYLSVELNHGETIIAEPGSMMFMDDNVRLETHLSDGSNPDAGFLGNLWSASKRAITGESFFLTHYTGTGHS